MVEFRQGLASWEPYKLGQIAPYDLANNENRLMDWTGLLKNIQANMSLSDLMYYGDNCYRDVIEKYANYAGVHARQVTAGVGSDFLIHMIVTTFLEKGDVFLTVDPDFFMYQVYNQLHDSRFEAYPLEWEQDSLHLSAKKLLIYAERVEAKVLMLSNPNNPSSVAFNPKEIEQILQSFKGLVVLDEAYIEFSDSPSFVSLIGTSPNLIVLRTLSKAFALAGLRLGFAIANERLIYELDKAIPPFSVSNVVAKIGSAALDYTSQVEETRQAIIALRREFLDFLAQIPKAQALPSQTNFVTFTFPKAEAFYRKALEQGFDFKYYQEGRLTGYIRMAIGRPEEMALVKQILLSLMAE
ncbi:aminotransferase class I/II-fold pyridoxal phosphate-dependent enzyme [Streptococcus sp. zg-86]|uniref:Aminotransferase class I/II-fold pyridoxal phosphate-dependent enzyme n=1 Tax=Streptococcus zhangguiae TaxID=2664091 RepID=A0A6I4RCX9_9STRE|nr:MULTISPECIES: aminotransferase class I/II-fold pyridoxal phosphate-dependent enzyme [unclassified Streptococcus]MTB64638.1 aminotransferase class I/II-fold pyridoxal phosphate-dependent enzyme [Streptococcus sp. zg-86]MTB90948.1 aminotransferase class I/II-fold pyridoxal phosphate-dependent enzyme [Streptococcus sp. zg-36]MWV56628.1 aminotransferase class I/II-fold pyridoxal phosphate-dependent enzyme [Streptococcus sp. zg-70]QTH48588.1 aminotransferase class I/II-fold pyridoxal phosphate-de